MAAIVARQPHAWNAAELFAFCQQRLERNSVPSYLQLVEQIPKTASEKPLSVYWPKHSGRTQRMSLLSTLIEVWTAHVNH